MRYLVIVALLVVSCLWVSKSSFAHWYRADPAKLTKLATLHDNDGNTYILERIKDTSSNIAKPSMTQMRDQNGFVVARLFGSQPYFCPSLDWCWYLSQIPKRFDTEFIRHKSKSHEIAKDQPEYEVSKSERDAFLDYLNNPETKEFSSKRELFPRGIRRLDSYGPMTLFTDMKTNRDLTFGAHPEHLYYLPILVLLSFYFLDPYFYLYAFAVALYHIPFVHVCKKCLFAQKYNSIFNKLSVCVVLAPFFLILFLPYFFFIFLWPLLLLSIGLGGLTILPYWLLFGMSLYLVLKIKKIIIKKTP